MESAAAPVEYARRLETRRASLQAVDRAHLRLGVVRLAILAAGAAVAYAVWGPGWLRVWWLLLPLAGFLWVGGRMQWLEQERARLGRAIAFYERGLERLAGRWAGRGTAGEHLTPHEHLYARDLDLFGVGSLFELLCAARTGIGQAMLADWLLAPADPATVGQRQAAVAELRAALDLREDMAVLGEDARGSVRPHALVEWGEQPARIEARWLRPVVQVLSLLGICGVAALLLHLAALLQLIVLPDRTLAWLRLLIFGTLMVNAGLLWRMRVRSDQVLHQAERAAGELDMLSAILARIEGERFDASLLRDLRARLDTDGQPPSRRLARLRVLMGLVDSRHSTFVRFLSPFLLWDLHLCFALERWRAKTGPRLRHWLHAVAAIEALVSLAAYHYENPEDAFPEIVGGDARFEAEALGHPLLARDALVRNDVVLGPQPRVLVVSGSNMSGKSTLLRAVGVGAVLAQAGAPVRARRLRLSPLAAGASIRIVDSLREGTSRFYAEIKRLKAIMERASGATPVLFLIDEMLHGTNSHDRRRGAEAVVRGLLRRRAVGLLTTHDLALTEIAQELGPEAANVHFADHLEGGRMRFDYRVREGVVRKSNAIELMRSVGLDV